MKKIILCLMIGVLSANFAGAEENKNKNQESLLILEIDTDGKVYIGGNHVSDEKLKKLLSQIAVIDKSFQVIIRADRNGLHEYIKKYLELITDNGLYHVKFQAVRGKLNTTPKPLPKPSKPVPKYEIEVGKDGYTIKDEKKSLADIKKLFSKMSDKERKESTIIINVGKDGTRSMLVRILDLCAEESLTMLNVIDNTGE